MSRRLHRSAKRWLELEQLGQVDGADMALRQVFCRLPLAPLSSDFARRVLARAGILAHRTPWSRWQADWGLPAALGLAVLLAGAVAVLLPGAFYVTLESIKGQTPMEIAVAASVGLLKRIGEGLAVWRILADVGRIFSGILEKPSVYAALVASALLSIAAFRALYGLMTSDRSARYVDPA